MQYLSLLSQNIKTFNFLSLASPLVTIFILRVNINLWWAENLCHNLYPSGEYSMVNTCAYWECNSLQTRGDVYHTKQVQYKTVNLKDIHSINWVIPKYQSVILTFTIFFFSNWKQEKNYDVNFFMNKLINQYFSYCKNLNCFIDITLTIDHKGVYFSINSYATLKGRKQIYWYSNLYISRS